MERPLHRPLLVPALAVLVALAAACGVDDGSATGPGTTGPAPTGGPTTTGPAGPPPGEVVEAELVALEAATYLGRLPAIGDALVADGAGWEAYAGSFATVGDLTDRLLERVDRPPSGSYLVAGVVAANCAVPEGVDLVRTGPGALELVATGMPDPEPVCVAPVVTVAALVVDGAAVDDVETVGGRSVAGPAGPATEVLLRSIDSGGVERDAPTAVELDPGDGVEALRRGLGLDEDPVDELPALADGDRRFGFVRSGCAEDTAELILTAELIHAALREVAAGATGGTDCAEAVTFVAVLDVDAGYVPGAAVLDW